MVYITLNNHPEYEIETEYPHRIRRIGSDEPISDRSKDSSGYIQVYLNGKKYYLHRIIAEQFIPNDDVINKTQIDHINHDRTDNHISNLRWVSSSTNQRNKTSFRGYAVSYVKYGDIPDDIIDITSYNNHELEGYFYSYSEDLFYYDTSEAYRVLPVRYSSDGYPYVYTRDVNNKRVMIFLNKFKKELQ